MDYQSLLLERCDPDQLTGVIDGSDMRHRVLPGGTLSVKVERLGLGFGTLQRGLYGMGILADGTWPGGLITVGSVLEGPTDAMINGVACPPLSVQLYSEGCDLSYRAAPGTTWFAYCVERERIQQEALRLYGRPLPIPDTGSVSIRPEEKAGRRIAAAIRALFAVGAHPEAWQAIKPLYASLQDQLHYDIACALHDAPGNDRTGGTKRVARRRRLMECAEDYLRASISEPFSLAELAEAAGTSHRMLEYRFRQVYGITPQAWFRCMKLNAVRRELRQSRGTGERISDIAMRWGFLHLGRFSQEYRRLFGECPKDTQIAHAPLRHPP